MQIIKEYNGFYELMDNSWSGAIDTLKDIERANCETEFMDYLEEIFEGDIPTDTQVNDFIWFERDMIYEAMGLDENGEVVDEEEEQRKMIEESIVDMSSAETFEDFCNDCDTCCLNCSAWGTYDDCEQAFDDFVNGKLAPDFIREEWGIL